jgi:hypothetical protein
MRVLKVSLLVLLLAGAGSVTGQTSRAPATENQQRLNYAFVSPNTRENLALDEAIKSLHSAEERKLITRIGDLACRLKSRFRIARAVGSWSDGAEHSVLVRITAEEPKVRYLLSSVGKSANQKSVLYFQDQSSGSATIYILSPGKTRRSLKSTAAILDQAGIAFRTLVPTRNGAIVYIVDLKRELLNKVIAAARRLRARLDAKTGKAEFIGDDVDRQKAQLVFAQEIKDYETRHPQIPATCASARR